MGRARSTAISSSHPNTEATRLRAERGGRRHLRCRQAEERVEPREALRAEEERRARAEQARLHEERGREIVRRALEQVDWADLFGSDSESDYGS